MKILSVRVARAIWLFPTIDINPLGRNLLPAVAAITERYQFAKPPDPSSFLVSPLKLKFEGGAFMTDDGTPRWVSLTIHDDGIVAEMRSSTEDCDQFLADALNWLALEFRLPSPNEIRIRKIYLSEVSIRFQESLRVFNDTFAEFVNVVQAGLGKDQPKPMSLMQLNFATDPANGQPVMLKIEREVGIAFGEGRYFSSATIQTNDHLKLLRKLEQAALG